MYTCLYQRFLKETKFKNLRHSSPEREAVGLKVSQGSLSGQGGHSVVSPLFICQ